MRDFDILYWLWRFFYSLFFHPGQVRHFSSKKLMFAILKTDFAVCLFLYSLFSVINAKHAMFSVKYLNKANITDWYLQSVTFDFLRTTVDSIYKQNNKKKPL